MGRLTGGEVIRHKRDFDGNPIGWENQNPIIDTRQYEVEFTNGEVTDITDNIISDWVYAQCNKYVNYTLLLDCFIDYRKMEQALSLQDQQLKVNGKP